MNSMMKTYVVHRDGSHGTEFLVTASGRWSMEFPDATQFTLVEARRLACIFKCSFHTEDGYLGLDGDPPRCSVQSLEQ